jgi:hypothetical protein
MKGESEMAGIKRTDSNFVLSFEKEFEGYFKKILRGAHIPDAKLEEKFFPGIQYIFKFPNGYGASVIKHYGSLGYDHGKWELAVLHDDDITYDTPITRDVLGFLDDADVKDALLKIQALTEEEVEKNKRLNLKEDYILEFERFDLEEMNEIIIRLLRRTAFLNRKKGD